MEANNSSSSSTTWGLTITETFKFKGKGAILALPLLAMSAVIITAIIYKCIRARRNGAEVDVQADVELAARD